MRNEESVDEALRKRCEAEVVKSAADALDEELEMKNKE